MKRLFVFANVLAIILLSVLTYLQFKSSSCVDELSQARYNEQSIYLNNLLYDQHFLPALTNIASTTITGNTARISVGQGNEQFADSVADDELMFSNNIQSTSLMIKEIQSQCAAVSDWMKILLYVTLALNIAIGLYNDLKNRRRTSP